MVTVTNLILFFLSLFCFRQLTRISGLYPKQMAWFILLMGISSVFGAAAHAIHYGFGTTVFNIIFFITNALNLLAIYYFFRGSYTYGLSWGGKVSKLVVGLVICWILVLLVITFLNNHFLLIKIHAGIILVYTLVMHYLGYRKNGDRGSKWVVAGISVSFLSIIVHSLHFSIDEWFNYKDIAHVIMILSLAIIYKGIRLNAEKLARHSA